MKCCRAEAKTVLRRLDIGWQHCTPAELESLTHIGIDVATTHRTQAIPAESPKFELAAACLRFMEFKEYRESVELFLE